MKILEIEIQFSISALKSFVDDVENNLNISINNIDSKEIDDVFDRVFYDIEKIDIIELNIINLHKAIEKLVTKIAKYFGENNNLYKYHEINKVLLDNGINIKNLNYFISYRELVSVSNKIKHGSLTRFCSERYNEILIKDSLLENINFNYKINNEANKGIFYPKELISNSCFNFENIQSFYQRVKTESFLFVEELSKKLIEIKKAHN